MGSLGFLFRSLSCGFLIPLFPVHGVILSDPVVAGSQYETFSLLPFPDQLPSHSPFRRKGLWLGSPRPSSRLHAVVEQTHDPLDEPAPPGEKSECQHRPSEDPADMTRLAIRPSDQVFVVWVFGHATNFFEFVLGLTNMPRRAAKEDVTLEAFVLPLEQDAESEERLHYNKILFLTISPAFFRGYRLPEDHDIPPSRALRAYISFALRMSHVSIFHYCPALEYPYYGFGVGMFDLSSYDNPFGMFNFGNGYHWNREFWNRVHLRRLPSGSPRLLRSNAAGGGTNELPPIEVKVRYSTFESSQRRAVDDRLLPPSDWRPQVENLAYAADKDMYEFLTERSDRPPNDGWTPLGHIMCPPRGLSVPPAAISESGVLRGVRLNSGIAPVFRTHEAQNPSDRRRMFFRDVVLGRGRADTKKNSRTLSDFSKVNPGSRRRLERGGRGTQ